MTSNPAGCQQRLLERDLFGEVYMDLPLGYKIPNCSNQGERLVSKLNKSIYGNAKFTWVLLHRGFHQSKADQSLFTKGFGNDFVALLVDVDDIVITGPNIQAIDSLKVFLHSLKDLGILKYFLGIEIARSQSGFVISQRHYTLQLLEDSGYLDCKPTSTPMDQKISLSSASSTSLSQRQS